MTNKEKKALLIKTRYVLLLSIVIWSCSTLPAYASLFGTSSEEACIEKHVVSAKSSYAAKQFHAACYSLYKEYKLSQYLRYIRHDYDAIATHTKNGDHVAYDNKKKKWVSLSNEQKKTIDQDFDKYVKKEKEQSQCVLRLKNMRDAENDWSAQIALSKSSCYEE